MGIPYRGDGDMPQQLTTSTTSSGLPAASCQRPAPCLLNSIQLVSTTCQLSAQSLQLLPSFAPLRDDRLVGPFTSEAVSYSMSLVQGLLPNSYLRVPSVRVLLLVLSPPPLPQKGHLTHLRSNSRPPSRRLDERTRQTPDTSDTLGGTRDWYHACGCGRVVDALQGCSPPECHWPLALSSHLPLFGSSADW